MLSNVYSVCWAVITSIVIIIIYRQYTDINPSRLVAPLSCFKAAPCISITYHELKSIQNLCHVSQLFYFQLGFIPYGGFGAKILILGSVISLRSRRSVALGEEKETREAYSIHICMKVTRRFCVLDGLCSYDGSP